MFGAAKDRLLPDVLSGLHTQYRIPVPAIIYLVSLKCQLVYSKCRFMHWIMRCIQHDMGDKLNFLTKDANGGPETVDYLEISYLDLNQKFY